MTCNGASKQQSIWIIFTGKTDIGWLKILKPGFRHCYALIFDGKHWLSIDPLATHTDIEIHSQISPDYNLPKWLESRGHIVLKVAPNNKKRKCVTLSFFSCVEVVKRLIGLHHTFIITPWQLYKFLQNTITQPQKEKEYG